jgi:cytochrome c2
VVGSSRRLRRKFVAWSFFTLWVLALTLYCPRLVAQLGDSTRGAQLLRDKRCTLCHSIQGVGGTTAPDLAKSPTHGYTPATMAALLWNHGPAMWNAMSRQDITVPTLAENNMRDIYAYFYALRYFDPPGDAARGKDVFTSKHCYRCHALTADAGGIGPPVPLWPTLFSDPTLWLQEMWNHAGEMARQMEREGIRWPRFTAREMVDLIVYVENLPGTPLRIPILRLGDPTNAAQLFDAKNCSQCHSFGDEPNKVNLLETTQQERRLTGLAVEMWNHRPLMEAAARNRGLQLGTFQGDEMADLLAYLFQRGYFVVQGDARHGERLFAQKSCSACHGQPKSGAPNLRVVNTVFTATRFAAAVWGHGPTMLDQMRQKGINWPSLTDRDVADPPRILEPVISP